MKVTHQDIEKLSEITDKKVQTIEREIFSKREKKLKSIKCILFFAPLLLTLFLASVYSLTPPVMFTFLVLSVFSLHINSDLNRKLVVDEICHRLDEEKAARQKQDTKH